MGERKEYKYGKGFSILIIVLAIAFIAFGVWFVIIPWILDDADGLFSIIFSVTGGILFAALGVVAIIEIKLSRFAIDNENLTTFGVLNNRSLSRSEIKGFRISDKYIYEGDHVAVILRKGKFGIPWFYVQRFASPNLPPADNDGESVH
jgi:hypothetical protein